MYTFLVIIMIIIALLLTLAVLVQRSKGGGFSSAVNANQFMGVQKSTDFIEKATWTLASSLFLLCILTSFLSKPTGSGNTQKSKLDDVTKEAPAPQAQPQSQPQSQPTDQPATNPDGTQKNP